MLSTLAVHLERDRHVFLVGAVAYVVANLILAAAAWLGTGGSALGWIVPAIAFFGNIFYTLTAEWEMRWEALWRREVPRLERELGENTEILTPLMEGSSLPRTIQRRMRIVSWILSAAWLVGLLVAIQRAGLRFGIAG